MVAVRRTMPLLNGAFPFCDCGSTNVPRRWRLLPHSAVKFLASVQIGFRELPVAVAVGGRKTVSAATALVTLPK